MSTYEDLAWDVVDYIKAVGIKKNQADPATKEKKHASVSVIGLVNTAYIKPFRNLAFAIEADVGKFDINEAEKNCRAVIRNNRDMQEFEPKSIEDRLRVALAYASGKDPSTFVLPSTLIPKEPDEVAARDNASARAVVAVAASLG